MIISLILFAVGMILLFKGADLTVEGAEGIASRLRVSASFIGLTMVAFGTSLPELVVTTEAFRTGEFGIGMGNIIGSNISNIALILGLCAFLKPGVCGVSCLPERSLHQSAFVLLATMIFTFFALAGVFHSISGIVMLACFSGMLVMLWRSNTIMVPAAATDARYPLLTTIAGLTAVTIGAKLLLTGAVAIAEYFSIPSIIIGLSMVAIGTSLPELATSVVAACRNSAGIAVGTIFGSNIFNLLFIMGLNALFFPIPAPDVGTLMPLLLFTIAVFPLFSGKQRITRGWGAFLIGSYVVYMLALFVAL